MKRLTTNKDVSEMSMTELAYNCCYAKERKARYRNYETDIDARELAIKLLDKYADVPNEFTCDEDFDDFILDSLQYGTDNILGLIAIFYENLWAMADLRERLKEYEDIGLIPEQLIEVDKLYAEKCRELAELKESYLSGLELAQIWAEMEKLKEYRHLVGPCKIGDKIYVIPSETNYKLNIINGYSENNRVYEQNVNRIEISEHGYWLSTCDGTAGVSGRSFKETWFLSREEADTALKELGK